MGTTVTTNLGLILPDTDESIREDLPTFDGWAAQNAANMDKIDSLYRRETSTPALVWGATTTNPVLGAGGTTELKVIRFLPRMVLAYFKIFTGGVGFTVGSGSYTFNLPVAIDPAFAPFSHTFPVGKMIFYDSGTIGTSTVMPLLYSPSSNKIFGRPSEGGTWTAAAPVVPGQSDRYSGYFYYPTDQV